MRRTVIITLAAALLFTLPQAGQGSSALAEGVHIVRPGENLTVIARRYGVGVSALRANNGVGNPNLIRTGIRLWIPGSGPATATHVVAPGENLTLIARRYGLSVATLRSLNRIPNPNFIRAGTRLRVPAETSASGGSGGSGATHVVRPGESLSVIAQRHGMSTTALALHNGIENPHLVWAGRTLRIPASGGVQAASTGGMRPMSVPSSRAHLRGVFERYAAEAGVPADLLMALGWQESGWQQAVVSSTGAVGVMQLMPATVDFVSQVLLRRRTPLDPRDPEQNIRMGAHQLRYLLSQTGSTELALVAYYQGLGALRRNGPYDESRRFAANVIALRSRF